MRVAIVHDYLTQRGGAERVVLALARAFPDAPLFTSLYAPSRTYPEFSALDVRSAPLSKLIRDHRLLLPLYPGIFRWLGRQLPDYDVVISSSSAWAHRVPVDGALHICYCHSPARFIWRLDEYVQHESASMRMARPVFAAYAAYARRGDREAIARVDHLVANSERTAGEIRQRFGLDAAVIHPPVDVERVAVSRHRGDFFLVMSRLVSYKRVDIAVAAAVSAGVDLVVAGEGPARAGLERLAGPRVRFVGRVTDEERDELFQKCTALVVPGVEDFGITPVESMASGKPVIAFAAGGALETVTRETGILVPSQTSRAFAAAMEEALAREWSPAVCRTRAELFGEEKFAARMQSLVANALAEK